MEIPLDEFEHVIDATILKRGHSYFKKGHVIEFTALSSNEYEAIVSGATEYLVQLTVQNNIIVGYECDCPYDHGPVCKHIVAVIFHLNEERFRTIEISPQEDSKKRQKKEVCDQTSK